MRANCMPPWHGTPVWVHGDLQSGNLLITLPCYQHHNATLAVIARQALGAVLGERALHTSR